MTKMEIATTSVILYKRKHPAQSQKKNPSHKNRHDRKTQKQGRGKKTNRRNTGLCANYEKQWEINDSDRELLFLGPPRELVIYISKYRQNFEKKRLGVFSRNTLNLVLLDL